MFVNHISDKGLVAEKKNANSTTQRQTTYFKPGQRTGVDISPKNIQMCTIIA